MLKKRTKCTATFCSCSAAVLYCFDIKGASKLEEIFFLDITYGKNVLWMSVPDLVDWNTWNVNMCIISLYSVILNSICPCLHTFILLLWEIPMLDKLFFFYFHGYNSEISKLTFAFLISCITKFWSTLQASAFWVGWKTFQDSVARSGLVKVLQSNMEASMPCPEDEKFSNLLLIFLIVLKMQLNTIT